MTLGSDRQKPSTGPNHNQLISFTFFSDPVYNPRRYPKHLVNSKTFAHTAKQQAAPTISFLVKGAAMENFSLETLGTLNFKILGLIEVSGTGLGIIVAGALIALIVPKVMRARK